MPTLNIEGQKVKVDDGFLNLSPEQQTATVEEIAASLGIKSGRVKGSAPEGQEPDIYKRRAEAEANVLQERRQQGGLGDFLESAVTNLPFGRSIAAIPGGAYRMLSDGVNPIEGWRREKALIQEQAEQRSERSPVADMAGAVTGGVAGAIPVVRGAQALGLGLKAGAGLGARMTAGAAGGAGMGAVYGFDQADAGERVQGATRGMLTGAALGGAIPAVGAGIRKVGGKVASSVRGVVNPEAEAAARVRAAMARDAGRAAMSADDVAAARLNRQPIVNADRGGETTRALAKASANASPEARGQIETAINDRFYDQSRRAVEKVSNIVGNRIDDLKIQDDLRTAARKANSGNYEKAYRFNFGAGQPVELDAIQQRIPASAMREAMRIAKAEGRPFGEQLVASIDEAADAITFRRTPSMREWDYIQRGLKGATDSAFRGGSGGAGTAYRELRQELLSVLDDVNPAFKQARAGAAAAFGAEDALDAGRMFARSSRNTGEMARAVAKMNPAEKKLFETGFASELVDRLKSSSDRVNVINQVFGSPESREKMVMAFGKTKATEMEAFVRVEDAMMALKAAMGNSTTARQLVELGLVSGGNAGAGAWGVATGDYRALAVTGALTGYRYGKGKIDQRVVQKIAEILLSDDAKAMDRVVNNAKLSSSYMQALRALSDEVGKIAPMAGAAIGVGATSQ